MANVASQMAALNFSRLRKHGPTLLLLVVRSCAKACAIFVHVCGVLTVQIY